MPTRSPLLLVLVVSPVPSELPPLDPESPVPLLSLSVDSSVEVGSVSISPLPDPELPPSLTKSSLPPLLSPELPLLSSEPLTDGEESSLPLLPP